jgi:hypothetical protein
MRHLIAFALALAGLVALGFAPGLASADPPEPQPATLALAAPVHDIAPAHDLDPGLMAYALRAAPDCGSGHGLTPQPDTAALLPPALVIDAAHGRLDPNDDGNGEGETAHGPPVQRWGPPPPPSAPDPRSQRATHAQR